MVFAPRRSWDRSRPSVEGSVSRVVGVDSHRCGVGDVDFSLVGVERLSDRRVWCRVCGREWRLEVRFEEGVGGGRVKWAAWWPFPCPGCGVGADVCRHYGGKRSSGGRGRG